MRHAISLSIALGLLWILLSGYFDPLLLGLGAASVALVVWITLRMDIADHEGHPIHLTWRVITYWPWLIKEIIVANIDVTRAILSPKMPLHLGLFRVPASQKTELGHTIYANSITLTPGTVTVAVEDDQMTVHALLQSAEDGLKTGEMDRRVTAFEGHADEGGPHV